MKITCPYCKKEIDSNAITLNNILKELKNPQKISSLANSLNMKRSTLIYYLKILKDKKLISTERVKKGEMGRPTYICLIKK